MDLKGSRRQRFFPQFFWNQTVSQTYYDEVKYAATPTLALIKVTGERTSLRVETEEIKSTWPEGNYDSLMLFWLWHWDVFFFFRFSEGGLESPPVSQLSRRATLREVLATKSRQGKHQRPPSSFHCSTNTWRHHLSPCRTLWATRARLWSSIPAQFTVN